MRYEVSNHAVARYRERVRDCSRDEAVVAVRGICERARSLVTSVPWVSGRKMGWIAREGDVAVILRASLRGDDCLVAASVITPAARDA